MNSIAKGILRMNDFSPAAVRVICNHCTERSLANVRGGGGGRGGRGRRRRVGGGEEERSRRRLHDNISSAVAAMNWY